MNDRRRVSGDYCDQRLQQVGSDRSEASGGAGSMVRRLNGCRPASSTTSDVPTGPAAQSATLAVRNHPMIPKLLLAAEVRLPSVAFSV
jgi:hypothetical protein